MDDGRQLIIGVAAGLVILGAVVLWDHYAGLTASIEERMALIERKLEARVRPVIQINNASVWNTDGEIVIEEHRAKSKEQGVGDKDKGDIRWR